MRNNANRLFVFLLGVAWLWGCCGAVHATTPMVSAGMEHSIGKREFDCAVLEASSKVD